MTSFSLCDCKVTVTFKEPFLSVVAYILRDSRRSMTSFKEGRGADPDVRRAASSRCIAVEVAAK